MPCGVLGCVWEARASGAGDGERDGAAVAEQDSEPERYAGWRADAGVQDRRRRRVAAAGYEGPAGDAAACGGQFEGVSDAVWEYFGGEYWSDSTGVGCVGSAGWGSVLWRTGAEY